MPILSIIILSFNTKELTIRSVESIVHEYKNQLKAGTFELIVVDNASSDGTVVTINKQLSTNNMKAVGIIENKENYGFSKGNNVGASRAKGKYLLFLNSDTEVKDSGLLQMIDFFDKHNEVAILGGKLTNEDGTPQPSCGKFYTVYNTILMLVGAEKAGFLRKNPREASRVDWVSGASMMVKKKLFDRLGRFDERFFMYMEDMELCFRARKSDFSTYFFPDVKIVHKELGSSNRAFAILSIYKGLLYFYKKHKNYMTYTWVKLALMLKACVAIIVGILTRNSYLLSTYKRALALCI